MNTKILSILMMLVIAAHVVSTSAVIASEKKRLQSQDGSVVVVEPVTPPVAEPEDGSVEVPSTADLVEESLTRVPTPIETLKELFWRFSLERENEVIDNMVVYHTATGEFFTTETQFGKYSNYVEALAKFQKDEMIRRDMATETDFDGIYEKVEPVLAFKAFEKMKELVPFSFAQRTCLKEGECAQELLHKITFLAKTCYDNDNTVEDLKNKITERVYTLDLGSDMNAFSTNYVQAQQQTQIKPESDDEDNEGGAHHLYTLKNEDGWITLHDVLTGLFFHTNKSFPEWFKEGKNAANYEDFFNQLKEFMGIKAAEAMGGISSSLNRDTPLPMQMAFGCFIDDTDGVGCKNEMIFSTWRCALAGLNFNTPLADMEAAEAAR